MAIRAQNGTDRDGALAVCGIVDVHGEPGEPSHRQNGDESIAHHGPWHRSDARVNHEKPLWRFERMTRVALLIS